ncbi:hypothetical protein D3C75_752290 [compost metagenome]
MHISGLQTAEIASVILQVIRFNIRHDPQPRMVLQEGAVALIRFGYNVLPLSRLGVRADIHNFPADNIRGVNSAILHNQRDHGGGGRFAVCTGNRYTLALIEQPGKHLRAVQHRNVEPLRFNPFHIITCQSRRVYNKVSAFNLLGCMSDIYLGSFGY